MGERNTKTVESSSRHAQDNSGITGPGRREITEQAKVGAPRRGTYSAATKTELFRGGAFKSRQQPGCEVERENTMVSKTFLQNEQARRWTIMEER